MRAFALQRDLHLLSLETRDQLIALAIEYFDLLSVFGHWFEPLQVGAENRLIRAS
jgi:hypothetical protein